LASFPSATGAGFVPVSLTPGSYNHDIVVERTAPPPVGPATSASMDGGLNNSGFSWFEKGYNADWPSAGLPAAGTVITSDSAADHEYQFAPDYRSNNAVLIDRTVTNVALVLAAAQAYNALSFLLSGANESATVRIGCAVYHEDGSVETNTIGCPDWMNNMYSAYSANGRVNVTNFTFANVNGGVPMLFAADMQLGNSTSAVTRIELGYVNGAGHSAVFAVSGAGETGAGFRPIGFRGYNADMVVEGTAMRPQSLTSATSGSMETGGLNTLRTWYERGYCAVWPESGLPAAGSVVTNGGVGEDRYELAPSYSGNNVALIDGESPVAELAPKEPVICLGLSVLGAAVQGPVTNGCVVEHQDGSRETNQVVVGDWYGTGPCALAAGGRVNLNSRIIDSAGGGPRLFAAEVMVANRTSAVTNVVVSYGGRGGRVAIFALSAAPVTSPAGPAVLSIGRGAGGDGSVVIRSSAPGRLEWTSALEGANTVWQPAGAILDEVTITPGSEQVRYYRVVGQ
jgi:hypothetical protein